MSEEQNPLADILGNHVADVKEYRIPFDELCGFYAAFVWGTPIAWVQSATGLSVTTAAHLKAAGQFRGGQRRYPKVRAEFDRMGKTAFSTKYLTASIRDRLRVAGDLVNANRGKPNRYEAAGVQPRATKYTGVHTFTDHSTTAKVEIVFSREPPMGWRWRLFEMDGHPLDEPWRGDPHRQELGFASSADAYTLCRIRFTPTDSEMENGAWARACNDEYLNNNR